MTPAQRLTALADHLQTYGAEQAIIYVYGLPVGGCSERHKTLIADIRTVIGASSDAHRIDELEADNARLADQVQRFTRAT